jgi:hypothetical protein
MRRGAFASLLVLLLVSAVSAVPVGAQETSQLGAVHGGHDLHFDLHVGWWNFDDAFRYEDDVLFGMTLGAWVTPSLSLELDLEPMRTRNERVGEWVQAVFVNLHGRWQYKPEALLSPGILTGVSFMAADNEKTENSITEGFDIGPVLAVRLGQRTSLLVEALFRYASVRVNLQKTDGGLVEDPKVEYVWSSGVRLGVDFAF